MLKYLAAILLAIPLIGAQAVAEPVHILAAFTFRASLDAVIKTYEADTGRKVVAIYGPTPALAKQIENGAPGDIFLSANKKWMDYVEKRGFIQTETRTPLLTTDLVLVTRSDNTAAPTRATVDKHFPLGTIVGNGRIAMCNPADHPAGMFARASLQSLGLWGDVADKLAIAENSRAAVALVDRGEAPMAAVFGTDVRGVSKLKVAGVFPAASHPPIVFPIAMLRGRHASDAVAFYRFLRSAKSRTIFERFGYRRAARTR